MSAPTRPCHHNHLECSSRSAALCCSLYAALANRIDDLRQMPTQWYCGFCQADRSRFYYVRHRKDDITVWPFGSREILLLEAGRIGVELSTRRADPEGGWPEAFDCHFVVAHERDIPAAVEILLVSLRLR